MISYSYMRKRFTQRLIICLGICISILSLVYTKVSAATIVDFYIPTSFSFTKDLNYGTSTNPDVYYLQNLLNMSTSTRVAETGPGSNAQLSTYYGDRTRDAVARFQNVFAVDIAYEKSISTSTATSTTIISSSTVDMFTRAVLNKLIIIYSGDRERYFEYLRTGTTTATTEESIPAEEPPAEESAAQTTNSSGSNNNNSNNSSGGLFGNMQTPHEFIYQGKQLMFTYSPQGQLLRAIGGQRLVNTVFSYTPPGQLGKLFGMSGNSNSNSGLGALGALAGAGGSQATQGTKLLNFGGQSVAMTTCTCSDNVLLFIDDVRGYGLQLLYQPGVTILYKMYRPTAGVNVLGQYVTGGYCAVYDGESCHEEGAPEGTMTQLGTSLTIGKTN